MGGLFGIVVIILRQYLVETPDFLLYIKRISEKSQQATSQWKRSNSFTNVISRNKRGILIATLLYGIVGATSHFYFVFWGPYLSTSLNILDKVEATQNVGSLVLLYTLCVPLAGYMADRFGLMRVLKTGLLIFVGTLIISMFLLGQGMFPIWAWIMTAINLSFIHSLGYVILFGAI